MTTEERTLFINLLFAHKHLWTTFQEYRFLQEYPDTDWESAHERFSEEAYDVYQSVADALLEGRPLQDTLETVLLHGQLTQNEVIQAMKRH